MDAEEGEVSESIKRDMNNNNNYNNNNNNNSNNNSNLYRNDGNDNRWRNSADGQQLNYNNQFRSNQNHNGPHNGPHYVHDRPQQGMDRYWGGGRGRGGGERPRDGNRDYFRGPPDREMGHNPRDMRDMRDMRDNWDRDINNRDRDYFRGPLDRQRPGGQDRSDIAPRDWVDRERERDIRDRDRDGSYGPPIRTHGLPGGFERGYSDHNRMNVKREGSFDGDNRSRNNSFHERPDDRNPHSKPKSYPSTNSIDSVRSSSESSSQKPNPATVVPAPAPAPAPTANAKKVAPTPLIKIVSTDKIGDKNTNSESSNVQWGAPIKSEVKFTSSIVDLNPSNEHINKILETVVSVNADDNDASEEKPALVSTNSSNKRPRAAWGQAIIRPKKAESEETLKSEGDGDINKSDDQKSDGHSPKSSSLDKMDVQEEHSSSKNALDDDDASLDKNSEADKITNGDNGNTMESLASDDDDDGEKPKKAMKSDNSDRISVSPKKEKKDSSPKKNQSSENNKDDPQSGKKRGRTGKTDAEKLAEKAEKKEKREREKAEAKELLKLGTTTKSDTNISSPQKDKNRLGNNPNIYIYLIIILILITL
jgi:hypothetical protein